MGKLNSKIIGLVLLSGISGLATLTIFFALPERHHYLSSLSVFEKSDGGQVVLAEIVKSRNETPLDIDITLFGQEQPLMTKLVYLENTAPQTGPASSLRLEVLRVDFDSPYERWGEVYFVEDQLFRAGFGAAISELSVVKNGQWRTIDEKTQQHLVELSRVQKTDDLASEILGKLQNSASVIASESEIQGRFSRLIPLGSNNYQIHANCDWFGSHLRLSFQGKTYEIYKKSNLRVHCCFWTGAVFVVSFLSLSFFLLRKFLATSQTDKTCDS